MRHSRLQDLAPFDFMGLLIRDAALDPTQLASVAHIEVAPGVSHPRAKSTSNDKLYVCLEGSILFDVGGTHVEVEPIDLLIVSKNEWFEYRNLSEERAVLLLFHVPPFDLAREVFEP